MKELRYGDMITIPKGWTVEIRDDGSAFIYHKHYTADSRKGFTIAEFFKAALEEKGND